MLAYQVEAVEITAVALAPGQELRRLWLAVARQVTKSNPQWALVRDAIELY